MARKLFGLSYKAGHRIAWNFLFIPVFKIKERRTHFRVYFLGIPLWKVSKETFQALAEKLLMKEHCERFVDELVANNADPGKHFVSITKSPYARKAGDAKLIAFYLPQFHAIPLNDENFGQGFTEWTNVTRAIPHFVGHYQPKLPIDVGFYDLSHDDVMYRQIELAKMYGIYGFCFHYYWFSGTRLLERPIFNYLNNKELDFPFCLCWANENWSKLWDGGNKEVIMEQKHADDDPERFFCDILPFFADDRYIKINNKPVLIIYRPQVIAREKYDVLIVTLRNLAKKNGYDDVFIMTTYRRATDRPEDFAMDAFVEFPPQNMPAKVKDVAFCNKRTTLLVYDMRRYILRDVRNKRIDFKLFRGVFPSWDNTARKAYSGGEVYADVTPDLYKSWLSHCIQWTMNNHAADERFIFINAWNEWAESAYLEPDQRYGYAYLQATKEAMEAEYE